MSSKGNSSSGLSPHPAVYFLINASRAAGNLDIPRSETDHLVVLANTLEGTLGNIASIAADYQE